jgi:hypothetical protein
MTTRWTRWTCGSLLAASLGWAALCLPHSETGAGAAMPPAVAVAARPVQSSSPRQVAVSVPAPAPENALYTVETKVRNARAAGAGDDEVYRLRAGALSAQTIAQITERELAEQQWLHRVDAWRAERARLNPGDTAALAALRERRFSADEQAQVDAYERSSTPQLILK